MSLTPSHPTIALNEEVRLRWLFPSPASRLPPVILKKAEDVLKLMPQRLELPAISVSRVGAFQASYFPSSAEQRSGALRAADQVHCAFGRLFEEVQSYKAQYIDVHASNSTAYIRNRHEYAIQLYSLLEYLKSYHWHWCQSPYSVIGDVEKWFWSRFGHHYAWSTMELLDSLAIQAKPWADIEEKATAGQPVTYPGFSNIHKRAEWIDNLYWSNTRRNMATFHQVLEARPQMMKDALVAAWKAEVSPAHTWAVLKVTLRQEIARMLPTGHGDVNGNETVRLFIHQLAEAHKTGHLDAHVSVQHKHQLDRLQRIFTECGRAWDWNKPIYPDINKLLVLVDSCFQPGHVV